MTYTKGNPDQPGPQMPRFGLLDVLQTVFLVSICLGAFFFLRPSSNPAQIWFRIGIIAFGTIGLLVVIAIRVARQLSR